MELLGFLLAVLAVAFVVAKVIFDRGAQKSPKTPRRDSEWKAFMEGLKDDARASGEVCPEDPSKAPTLPEPQSLLLKAKPQKPSEQPIVETTEFGADWYFERGNSGKTSGEILGMMFPQTLVDGKQNWEAPK